jgi:hypothetical protein
MNPRFLSLEFHTRFFPALLWDRLRPRERAGTSFTSIIELQILFVICFILLVTGIPAAIGSNSVIGWIAGGLGAAGALALFIHSIVSRKDPPKYDYFLIGVFFFFVFLGLTAGIFAGSLNYSLMIGLIVGTVGLIAGYFLGIMAGLWFQYLGWLASAINGLAILAIIGMFVVDLVILSSSLF